jgi:hypothetical protein
MFAGVVVGDGSGPAGATVDRYVIWLSSRSEPVDVPSNDSDLRRRTTLHIGRQIVEQAVPV